MSALITTRRMNLYIKRLETIERYMVALQAQDQNNLHMAGGVSLPETRNIVARLIRNLNEEQDPHHYDRKKA